MIGPMLVLTGGLPGTGKSTLARSLGDRLDALVVNRDVIEASLWRSGVAHGVESRRAANDLLLTLAGDALGQGRSLIIDSVLGEAKRREQLQAVAVAGGVACRLIECVCSDDALHRSRIEGRERGIEGWYELEWSDVVATRARYQSWPEQRLVLDAVEPFNSNLEVALDYCA
jgi:predicted kinase